MKIFERVIPLENIPNTYLSSVAREIDASRANRNNTNEEAKLRMRLSIQQDVRNLSYTDIGFLVSGEYHYPTIPMVLLNKINEYHRLYNNSDFSGFSNSSTNAKGSIKMQLTTDDRSHFPGGTVSSLRGLNLGTKFYRALLRKNGVLTSGSSASADARRAWASMVRQKYDANNEPLPSDLYAITLGGPVKVIAFDLGGPNALSQDRMLSRATSFLRNNDALTANPTTIGISAELLALLPGDLGNNLRIKLDPARAAEHNRIAQEAEAERNRLAQAAAAEQAERATAHLTHKKLSYGLTNINDHNWENGDYVVVTQYFSNDVWYPIRKVFSRGASGYKAVEINKLHLVNLANNSFPADTRDTTSREVWTKINIMAAIPGNFPASSNMREAITAIQTANRGAGEPTVHTQTVEPVAMPFQPRQDRPNTDGAAPPRIDQPTPSPRANPRETPAITPLNTTSFNLNDGTTVYPIQVPVYDKGVIMSRIHTITDRRALNKLRTIPEFIILAGEMSLRLNQRKPTASFAKYQYTTDYYNTGTGHITTATSVVGRLLSTLGTKYRLTTITDVDDIDVNDRVYISNHRYAFGIVGIVARKFFHEPTQAGVVYIHTYDTDYGRSSNESGARVTVGIPNIATGIVHKLTAY